MPERRVRMDLPDDLRNNPEKVNLRNLVSRKMKEEDEENARQAKAKREADLVEKYKDVIDKIKAAPDITEHYGNGDKLEVAFDVLVPSSGKAETIAGEIVRAVMRVLYRWYNDGDVFYEGYGLKTVASSVNYLLEEIGLFTEEEIREFVENRPTEDKYEKFILDMSNKAIAHLLKNPGLFGEENNVDSRDYDFSFLDEIQPLYEYEIWVSDELSEYIEAKLCDSWKLVDYVENVLSFSNDTESAEVETPSTHYDTSVFIDGLTKDGVSVLEDYTRNIDSFWEDLVEELKEEHGSPENWENEDDDEEEDYED